MQYIAKSACKKDWKQKEKRSKQTLHFRGGFRVQNKLVKMFAKSVLYILQLLLLFLLLLLLCLLLLLLSLLLMLLFSFALKF